MMSGHKEIYNLINLYPEQFENIIEHEKKINSSFFKIDSVPKYARTGVCPRTGKNFTTAADLRSYLLGKNATPDMFADDEPFACSSYYNLCE